MCGMHMRNIYCRMFLNMPENAWINCSDDDYYYYFFFIIIIIIFIIIIIIIKWIVGTKCAVTAGDNITGFLRRTFELFEYFCANWLE